MFYICELTLACQNKILSKTHFQNIWFHNTFTPMVPWLYFRNWMIIKNFDLLWFIEAIHKVQIFQDFEAIVERIPMHAFYRKFHSIYTSSCWCLHLNVYKIHWFVLWKRKFFDASIPRFVLCFLVFFESFVSSLSIACAHIPVFVNASAFFGHVVKVITAQRLSQNVSSHLTGKLYKCLGYLTPGVKKFKESVKQEELWGLHKVSGNSNDCFQRKKRSQ